MNKAIKTHNPDSFTSTYMESGQPLQAMLKQDFGKFFIVKVEEMFRLVKLPVPPNRAITHSFIFLTEGEANMTIGSEACTIHQNECMVVPAGQVFSFNKPDVNTGYLCSFHNDFIIGKFGKNDLLKDFEFLRVWGNPRIAPDPVSAAWVTQLLQRIFREYTTYGLQNQEILQSCLITLLCEVNRAYQPVSGMAPTQAVHLTNQFKELLFEHIADKHLVADYAQLLHVSPNHLNKSVKSVTSKSPTKWIDEAIVLEAKVLLCQTTLSIGEIAAAVGLYDASYFSRLFKKYEGATPLAFRKMIETS